MIYRLILPEWALQDNPTWPKVLEGEFTPEYVEQKNADGYNAYILPNSPTEYVGGKPVDGADIDQFNYVFVDMDLKDHTYADKETFLSTVGQFSLLPSSVVDSGNGIHVYWAVSDLDAMSYLRLQRRLMRHFNTDPAVAKIFQLMRLPGSLNTKSKDQFKPCTVLGGSDEVYTCEELDRALTKITLADEEYCVQHHAKTYKLVQNDINIDDTIPLKFCKLLKSSKEVKDIWSGSSDDRSSADWRLGHIMFASGFSKEEAMSVLVNAPKALSRAPSHRANYAHSIVDKIWIYEISGASETFTQLSTSVKDILARGDSVVKGTRFYCNKLLDDTVAGFRLGQVIGLVAGSGVGKTSMAINMFLWFTELNPDFDHFFVSLEQTDNEIADRWRTITQGDTRLTDKVHVLSNYDSNGAFRHLSLDDIKDYIMAFQTNTGRKIGTVVIDHIGALKKQSKQGENQGLVDICHRMKSFAVETNTMVIMQSQAPREKAGIGDLELNKDSAYGTVFFESYVDYLLCIWQPLKRVYKDGAPTVMAFKFAKIRHKKQNVDRIQEDICYQLLFDPNTERLRSMTQSEEKSAAFFLHKATNIRKLDKKTDIIPYESRRVDEDGTADTSKNVRGTSSASDIH